MKHFSILSAALMLSTSGVVASAQSPALSPPSWLPGDDAIGLAAWNQTDVQIAAGGGGYLAVWTDSRSQAAGPQSDLDVYAMRLDASGAPVDATSFPVALGPCFQRRPQVAWNGESWLVAYESRAGTSYPQTAALAGVRVLPSGVVLDPNGFSIRPDDGGSSTLNWSLCANGSEWAVASQGTAPGARGVVGTRINTQGRVPAGVERMLVPDTDALYFDLRLVAAQGELLLAYTSEGQALARRFAVDFSPIGGEFPLPGANVGTNGSSYYVAWTEGGGLRGSPLSLDGTLALPQGATIEQGLWLFGVDRPGWDGTNWWIAFGSMLDGAMAARIAPSGVVLDPGGVDLDLDLDADVYGLRLAGGSSGGAELVWFDLETYDVYGRSLSATMQVGAATAASLSAPAELGAQLCAGPGGYVLVFDSQAGNTTRTLVQRLDPEGHAIDAQPIELGSGSGAGLPSAAWNGSVFCLAWNAGADVVARRMLPSGEFLDAAPIAVMPGFTTDVSALGDVFLIATTENTYGAQFRATFVRRLDGATGQLLDAAPIVVGSLGNYALYPRTAAFADKWVVVWQMNWTHDSLQADAMLCTIDAAGIPGPVRIIASAVGNAPDIAVGDGSALAVYRTNSLIRDDNDIEARLVLPDATMLPAFSVSAASGRQLAPAVTWDGSRYLLAWEDQREQIAFDDSCTDVYGARVDAGGSLLDPSSFVWRSAPNPVALPALATYGARTLLATSTFRSEVPFAAYRIEVERTLGDCAAPARFCSAVANTTGQPARIGATGTASFSADDLALTCADLPQVSFGLFFRGSAPLSPPAPFGAGRLCVAGDLQRLGALPIVDGTVIQTQYLNGPLWTGVSAGGAAYVQFWYRDSAAGPGVFNASDALELTFCD